LTDGKQIALLMAVSNCTVCRKKTAFDFQCDLVTEEEKNRIKQNAEQIVTITGKVNVVQTG